MCTLSEIYKDTFPEVFIFMFSEWLCVCVYACVCVYKYIYVCIHIHVLTWKDTSLCVGTDILSVLQMIV